MKLTPLDIRKQEFKRTMRGFDPEEVEAFLSMVADEMEMLIKEKNQINDELIKLRTQLQDYRQVESTLRETLVKAQNTVDESRANSRREAEIMIREAELQAENILKEAREELSNLRTELIMVRTQKESFAKRLRHLLESQIELLEVMDTDDESLGKPGAEKTGFEKDQRPEEPRIVRGEKKYNVSSSKPAEAEENEKKQQGTDQLIV